MTAAQAANPAPGFVDRPDYPITIEPAGRRVRVLLGETVLAESENALVLDETDYGPVYYFPRADVNLDTMTRTDHRTFCPYKGDASYWSAGEQENLAWSYEEPFDEMTEITGYVAFYRDRVEIEAGG